MRIKRDSAIKLIRNEFRVHKEVTKKSILLYIENRISYEEFLQIKNEEL